jgi:hypothetical protein
MAIEVKSYHLTKPDRDRGRQLRPRLDDRDIQFTRVVLL